MDFFQIIGFLIVILVLVLPVLQRMIMKKHLKKHPEMAKEEEKERELAYRRLLRSMEIEEEEEEEEDDEEEVPQQRAPPPPPAKKQANVPLSNEDFKPQRLLDDFRFRSDLDNFKHVSPVEARTLQKIQPKIAPKVVSTDMEAKPAETAARKTTEPMTTHIQRIVRERKVGREMILMYEILSPPKSMR